MSNEISRDGEKGGRDKRISVELPPGASIIGGLHALNVLSQSEDSPSYAPPQGEPVIGSLLDDLGRPVGTFDRAVAAYSKNTDCLYGAYTDEAVRTQIIKEQTAINERLDDFDRMQRINKLGFPVVAMSSAPELGILAASEYLLRPIPEA